MRGWISGSTGEELRAMTLLPQLPPGHISRTRLTRVLDESDGRSIVLNAPAGYGKTVLAVEWLAGKCAAWYTASAASADPSRLAAGIADALSSANGKILVIDDYHHLVASCAAEELVEAFVERSSLQVVVATRRRPSWLSARRVVYGEIVELSRDELALTGDEVDRALAGWAEHTVRGLVEEAERWPVVVGLARRSATLGRSKARTADDLLQYFAECADGGSGLAAKLVRSLEARPNGDAELAGLTPRENEVLRLISDGLSNPEIARRLFISEKTAKVHVSHIFEKLGVETRVQAVIALGEHERARVSQALS